MVGHNVAKICWNDSNKKLNSVFKYILKHNQLKLNSTSNRLILNTAANVVFKSSKWFNYDCGISSFDDYADVRYANCLNTPESAWFYFV